MNRTIRRILVPLDVSEFAEAATVRACEIAKAHDATISGMVVLDSPGIRTSVAPADVSYWPLVQDTILKATDDARERIRLARDQFIAICEAEGVPHTETEMEGVPATRILEASVLYDLLVMGLRTFFHFETQDQPGDSLAKVLGRTATPVVAVPSVRTSAPYRKVSVAWDGSFSSGRAFRDFMAFAAPYDLDLTVMTATDDERQGETLLGQASAFLKSRGVENFQTKSVRTESIDEICSAAFAEADLVVAGIHSKKLLKDLFVGSFTKHLIDRGDVPLFLSH
ncbi:MAG: universal stress protein [Verrucomicrobiae bacterium]|nr:universal stress protein [Verrucomicrobiae bacterium]